MIEVFTANGAVQVIVKPFVYALLVENVFARSDSDCVIQLKAKQANRATLLFSQLYDGIGTNLPTFPIFAMLIEFNRRHELLHVSLYANTYLFLRIIRYPVTNEIGRIVWVEDYCRPAIFISNINYQSHEHYH